MALLLAFADIALLLPRKRKPRTRVLAPLSDKRVVVALTAYNDAKSVQPEQSPTSVNIR